MFDKEMMQEIAAVAREMGVPAAALAAVAHIESGLRVHAMVEGRNEPLIRFEGHYFDRRLTGAKREQARAERLAAPNAGAIANPGSQAARWNLLGRAAAIDHKAAHESVSWGIGQVMGAHWAWLGYGSVDALVAEARAGLRGQLRLMSRFIERSGLADALRRQDWAAFARGYNGPAYRRNAYDTKLADAYARYSRTYAIDLSPSPAGTAREAHRPLDGAAAGRDANRTKPARPAKAPPGGLLARLLRHLL